MKEKEIKSKMLAEFREWFCESYCMFYGMEDYCSSCPSKDESWWLKSGCKKMQEKPKRKTIKFCDNCKHFIETPIPDDVDLNDPMFKPPFPDVCSFAHPVRFMVPHDTYNPYDEVCGFYFAGCKDYEPNE